MKSNYYPFTMRECIVDYLTAMGARTYTAIRNEVRVQCSDYSPDSLAPLLAQMATEGVIGMDAKRFAVATVDLVNAEARERALAEQRRRDALHAAITLFGPIPTPPNDDDDLDAGPTIG